MKCPVDTTELTPSRRDGLDVETCPSCKGFWLTRQELDELEDEAFEPFDYRKGTRVLESEASARKCPECGEVMRQFDYRAYDLLLEFCPAGHGFWLDAGEDKRVLELMRQEESREERSHSAEARWASELRHLRSGAFIDKLRELFR